MAWEVQCFVSLVVVGQGFFGWGRVYTAWHAWVKDKVTQPSL